MSAAPPPSRPVRRRAPSPLHVITASLGLFFVVLTLLAFQVRAGKDPSLSAGSGGSASSPSKAISRQATTRIATRTS